MARPTPLPPQLKRSYRVSVCFNQSELLRLEAMLAKPGLAELTMCGSPSERKRSKLISEFLRAAGLGERIPRPIPEINSVALWDLKRIGSNINQSLVMFRSDAECLRGDPQFIVNAKNEINHLCDLLVGIAPSLYNEK